MQIKELQSQIYEALKGIAVRQNNYNSLNFTIEKVFAIPECLNMSFRQYHNKIADINQHNMDIRGLELFYSDMMNNATGIHNGFQSILLQFFKTMNSGIEVMKFVKEGETSYNNMRFLLIMLFCPMIYDESNKSNFIKMTSLLVVLKPYQKECLSRWLCSMPGALFDWIVRCTQKSLSAQIIKLLPENMDKNDMKSVTYFIDIFCCFLGIMSRSNEHYKRISIQSFRNPEVMKFFSHQDQYNLFKSKIQILNFINYPFLYDIHYKLKLLEIQNKDEQKSMMQEGMIHLLQAQANSNGPIQLNTAAINSLYLQVKVHRNNILLDSMNELMTAKGLKNPLKVSFIDELGDDAGGVKKQFFQILGKQLFDPNKYMFVTKNNKRFHWFNGMSFEDDLMFQFAGIVVGLSIYNGIMLDLRFPQVVYKKLLIQKDGQKMNYLDQLKEIQPDMYKSFKYILQTNESLDPLELYFAAQVMQFDQKMLVPLKKNGQFIRVSQVNKVQYVQEYSKYLIDKQISVQFDAFKKGFKKVVSGSMIKLFNPEELQRIICGLQVVNLSELRKSVKYQGYQQYSYIVKCLWEVLQQLDLQKKKAFLFFVTGSDRSPIGGLSTMKFTIQRHGPDSQNVPTSQTCSNILFLPQYYSKDKLRKKLLISLNNNQGFGLI